ncbi:MAG TPA: 3-deoxy-manno-octulosonate cytidylyltransferase [Verrucomicrobiae bacterium]|nr:3-deoxy-manno-octulosonate cytidylyltransferase [Verrucomicrobiae bacterium]
MTAAPQVLVVIPARHASVRFPGKPLAEIAGRPMIQHVVDRARQASTPTRIVIATDDERIVQAAKAFGAEAILTRGDHRTGTDRVAEVAVHIEADIYVNVQGDEPLVDPGTIDAVAGALIEDEQVNIATPISAITHKNDIVDPNVVKAVLDFDGNALYFSRAPVPWVRDSASHVVARHWKHIGIYGFRRPTLLEFPTLPPGELEHIEQLEQLRWLENGFRIRAVETQYDAVSVDVPSDVERVEKIIREGAAS